MIKRCGLIGKGIQYSISPKIHNDYYKKNQINLKYELFDMDKNELIEFLKVVNENEYVGFNITIPYKEVIINYLDELTYPASLIKAVNTISIKNGALIGHNTDYFGFIHSLEHWKINVEDYYVLILGSGGAAKAVSYALKDLKVKDIDIAGRDVLKVRRELQGVKNVIDIQNIKDMYKYDMIINCTPLGNVNNEIIPIELKGFKDNLIIYDLNYAPEKTKLLIEAENKGLKAINGRIMLEKQAYKAIDIWNLNT
ncbi:shikimate dehydrogenase [Clostridium algidicarnis]|uniref:shikimate dehydrogenase n=1 Tax=Clostridium algidicarnis TaxID=37659 RepID=UPI003FD6C071